MLDYTDHNFRIAYMEEEEFKLSSNYAPIKRTLYEWPSSKKTFRSIHRLRLQHQEHPVYVDISIIKTNKNSRIKSSSNKSTESLSKSSGAFWNSKVHKTIITIFI